MKILRLVLLLIFCQIAIGQTPIEPEKKLNPKKSIYLTEVLLDAMADDGDAEIVLDGYHILMDNYDNDRFEFYESENGGVNNWLITNQPQPITFSKDSIKRGNAVDFTSKLSENRILIRKGLTFKNCLFQSDLLLKNLQFLSKLEILNCQAGQAAILNSSIPNIIVRSPDKWWIIAFSIEESQIGALDFDSYGQIDFISFANNSIDKFSLRCASALNVGLYYNKINSTSEGPPYTPTFNDSTMYNMNRPQNLASFKIEIVDQIETLHLESNSFNSEQPHSAARIYSNFGIGNIKSVILKKNIFNMIVDFNSLSINNDLAFEDNIFKEPVAFTKSHFSEFINVLPHEQFEKGLGIFEDVPREFYETGFSRRNAYLYTGLPQEMVSHNRYNELKRVYANLYNIHKANGDLESANAIYSDMKDLDGVRYKYLYQRDGSSENYFKYSLNWLLKFYADHGTNPARSILVSIYVILIFGVFYFFFPSEWDVTSKSKLVKNFKELVAKNEKGYFKPLMALIGGFLVSLANALTLSLNSFITLGFGTIPTTGFAKYLCVIQGFIGWFLLSIFTVTIINQVIG